MKARAMYVGRFQPFHKGHEHIIRQKLDKGVPVLILVRNMEPDEKNPLTSYQSKLLIQELFQGEDVLVQVIPDIESINWGRGVGYEVNELEVPDNIKAISATQIRERIRSNDDSWKLFVNEKIHYSLVKLLL